MWHRTDHCIIVCGKWILDSNFEVAFPLTQDYLNYTRRVNDTDAIKFVGVLHSIIDLFQPKMALFSTRALIWVHLKTVHYFSQSILNLFSYLKMHNTILFLNSVVHNCYSKTLDRYLLKLLPVSYPLNYWRFAKIQKKCFIAQESSHHFG